MNLHVERMNELVKRLGPEHPRVGEARILLQRLLDNVKAAELHGDTANLKHERSEILATCDALSLETTSSPVAGLLPDRLLSQRPEPKTLAERIDEQELWQTLKQAAVQAVIAGGTAAMTFYGGLEVARAELPGQQASFKNPSTEADLYSTSIIIQTINLYLEPLALKLGCDLYYLGEETQFAEERQQFKERLRKNLVNPTLINSVKKPSEFFVPCANTDLIRVIFDAIDGTVNFTLGIPLFCSGLAILINDNVRVSAIYDPFHHIVYTGVLQGLDEHAPEQIAEAQKLHVASGNWIPLREAAEQTRQRNRRKQVIGIHLTRSHDDKLAEFLGTNGPEDWSQLGALAREFGGIYALNSGILAMTEVARGAFGGFVNNITNPWDVAPGEVLVKACGGKVTDFQGHPIDYATKGRRTSVVAGYNAEFHQDIVDTLGKHSH